MTDLVRTKTEDELFNRKNSCISIVTEHYDYYKDGSKSKCTHVIVGSVISIEKLEELIINLTYDTKKWEIKQ